MSNRPLPWLAVLAVLLAPASASAQDGAAEARPKAIFVWAGGLTVHDLLACDDARPALCRLGKQGSLALVSTRTSSEDKLVRVASASSGVTMSALAHAEADVRGSVIGDPDVGAFRRLVRLHDFFRIRRPGEPDPGPVLVAAGLRPVVLARREPVRAARTVLRASAARCCAVLLDAATLETARAREEGRETILDQTVGEVDAVLGELMDRAPRGTAVYVVGAIPPKGTLRAGAHLGVLAAFDRRGPALLRSPTTRRAGVVTLADIGPSVARAERGEGRPWTWEAADKPAARLAALESDLVKALAARHPSNRRMLIFAMVSVGLAAAMIIARKGVARAGAFPRGMRAWGSVAALACAMGPLWLFVVGALPIDSVLAMSVAGIVVVVLLAIAGRAELGTARTMLLVCLASAVVPVVDLIIGTPLAHRSPFAFQIAGGGRFYGVDEGVLGMVLGAHLVAAGYVLDRVRAQRRWLVVAAVSFVVVAWVLGAPGLGSKFGAPLTAVPAFGVMLVKAGGKRFNLATIAAIAAATIAMTGLMVGADRLRSSGEQSHVARVTEGKTDAGDIVSRKIEAQIRITVRTIWSRAVLVFGGALLLIRLRRREAWDRGLWGRPALRAALTASAVGAACGFVFNDGGIIASAPTLLYAAVGGLLPMLEDAGGVPARSQA